jgi:hypothetical protein
MINLDNTVPIDLIEKTAEGEVAQTPSTTSLEGSSLSTVINQETDAQVVQYVVEWYNKLKKSRQDKVNVWNECWQIYRGVDDFSDKEDWQSKIVLPKAWSSVKQATSTIKRLLKAAKDVWTVEAVNPDDYVTVARASQVSDLTKVFLENANYMDAFAEGLECGFIIGVGIWKVWWAIEPRQRTRVRSVVQGPQGPQEISDEQAQQLGIPLERQVVREDVIEGKLQIRAVDPYNFWWLPGSKLNKWVGTIEEIEIPKWQLMDMANQGIFNPEVVKNIQPLKINEEQKQGYLRFNERAESSAPNGDLDLVKLLDFYGPLILNGQIVNKYAHIFVANKQTLLLNGSIPTWQKQCPYIGYSPLSLPFRTEGVGLIEMVREIDKALSRLSNMSVDTLLFKLIPTFEVNLDAYENPEDMETGLTPGKMLRRNSNFLGQPGITPLQFEDISQGSIQVQAALDRFHQEGALVSEIQQAIPRYRGVQTATEIEAKSQYQDSFFGGMAADIEAQALKPLIQLAVDLILQYVDTANDPRVANILGLGAKTLQGMKKEEVLEIVQGDYQIKVSGLSEQLNKIEMLQNLTQLINILGQSPEAWMPYVNQDELLRRVLEAFRPTIRDIENVVAEPALVEARKMAASGEAVTPELVAMIPTLVQQALQARQQEQQVAMQNQQQQAQQIAEEKQLALRKEEMEHEIALEAMKQGHLTKPPTGE